MEPSRQPAFARTRSSGITLIELMIALSVVSIIVATALPSYREYARRSLRTELQGFLVSAQVRQQQFLLDTRAYVSTLSDLGVPLPARLSAAYSISFSLNAGPPQTYTITAVPQGDQANDSCGTLTINQAGTRTAAKASCW